MIELSRNVFFISHKLRDIGLVLPLFLVISTTESMSPPVMYRRYLTGEGRGTSNIPIASFDNVETVGECAQACLRDQGCLYFRVCETTCSLYKDRPQFSGTLDLPGSTYYALQGNPNMVEESFPSATKEHHVKFRWDKDTDTVCKHEVRNIDDLSDDFGNITWNPFLKTVEHLRYHISFNICYEKKLRSFLKRIRVS